MQTFVPYPHMSASAAVLDRQRLGKQRVETLQIMRTLAGISGGWGNHPAVKMWSGYEAHLMWYQIAICEEWVRRGYRDTCLGKTMAIWSEHLADTSDSGISGPVPPWWGSAELHASHRSNLLRKEPSYYREFWPLEADDLPYVWPV